MQGRQRAVRGEESKGQVRSGEVSCKMQAARKASVPLSNSTPCPELKVLASIPRSVSAIYSHMNTNVNVNVDAQQEHTDKAQQQTPGRRAESGSISNKRRSSAGRQRRAAGQGGRAGRQGRTARCWLLLAGCRWVLLTMRESIATM